MRSRYWIGREAAAVCEATGSSDPIAGMQLLASRLLDEGGWDEPPAPPRILASFQGVRGVRPAAMRSAGRLVHRDGGLVIEVNEEHSPGKRNFTADHEVSHTLVPTFAGQPVDDPETGTFSRGNEEELLCDLGAAALLLPPRWLRPRAVDAGPSIATLLDVVGTFESSLEAAARQIAHLDCWPAAFVCWEEGYRTNGRIGVAQATIPGLEGFGTPQPKWRIARPYPTRSFGHYLPTNKSIDDTSLVAACCEAEPFTWGIEDIDLGKGPVRMYCENYYAPYRRGAELRRRVISLLLAVRLRSGQPAVPRACQLEML